MNTMNMPGFTAEASLSPVKGTYRGRVGSDRPSRGEVSMQLDNSRYDRLKWIRLKNWDHLFTSPGFEEETCDTGAADCAKRCINELNAAKEVCRKIVDESRRQACFNEAVTRGSTCQTNCSRSFQSIPGCPPIGL